MTCCQNQHPYTNPDGKETWEYGKVHRKVNFTTSELGN